MAKEIVRRIKLQIPAGKATPAPPVGTALGPAGINLQEFCTKYNDATRDKMGDIIPVEIMVYEDRTFDFVLKTPPAASLIKKFAKINSGSKKGAHEIVATLSKNDVKAIAEIKLPDLNAYSVEEAMKIIEGTARNMGVAVEGVNDAELAEEAKEAAIAEKEAEKREAELEAMEESMQSTNVDVEVITEKQETEE
ncbi:50S ribosomal protein L11 [Firmicutes bacterium CAG:582]|nr:50S ribosomal protein L11 [bacterium]CDB29035.1 50S ribosomal protein L11 [Firmicutes bacterium CAG:582]